MATYLENLKTARANAAERLATLAIKIESNGEGVNAKHHDHRRMLLEEIAELDALIEKAEDEDAADGGDVGIVESEEWTGR